MRITVLLAGAVAIALASIVSSASASPRAGSAIPSRWKNCTIVNRKYAHGVGRAGARDKTSGTPVTTFTRSSSLYRTAMRYNRGLDRDKDGIACEKR